MPKVFVSYRFEEQQAWVVQRLVPILHAAGAAVLIDRKDFRIGCGPNASAEALQAQCDFQVLVLSASYFTDSVYCRHELARAHATDPDFTRGTVVPIRRDASVWPVPWGGMLDSPLYVDLPNGTERTNDEGWTKIVTAVGGRLEVSPTSWLDASEAVSSALQRPKSVNLVCDSNAAMKALVAGLRDPPVGAAALPRLHVIDLDAGATRTPEGLVRKVLQAVGVTVDRPTAREALETLEDRLEAIAATDGPPILAFLHGSHVADRNYGVDLFRSLRFCTESARWLVLLFCSTAPLRSVLPTDHVLSQIGWQTIRIAPAKGGAVQ